MFIRAYLRVSTEDQFADRAKKVLEQFVQDQDHKIASYYRKNISGTKFERPELGRLLMDDQHNDILLVELIGRLTRLSNSDWITLKKQIEQLELRIVSLDVPTSWQALSDNNPSQADPITRAVITAINNMLIDLMVTTLQKVLYYRQVKKLSIRETVDATEYSPSQIRRIQALSRQSKVDKEASNSVQYS